MSFNYDHYLLSFQMCTSVVYKKPLFIFIKSLKKKKALQIPEKKNKENICKILV